MNYYNDLTSRRQWNGWDWAQKSVNDVMGIPLRSNGIQVHQPHQPFQMPSGHQAMSATV
jgi:hypothetical protein